MDKCFIDALFANTDKKVKGEENQMKEKKINFNRKFEFIFLKKIFFGYF